MNLKQGRISIKKYALKFYQQSRYAPNLVADMRVRLRIFASGPSHNLVLESKIALLIKDMDILRLVVHTK